VLIVDASIAEKPYTDENDIICWHYDHAQDRQVKGINFLSGASGKFCPHPPAPFFSGAGFFMILTPNPLSMQWRGGLRG
jgi:hypothetical protein